MISKKLLRWAVAVFGLAAVVLVSASAFFVDDDTAVVLTRRDMPAGEPITTPGLHFRKPFLEQIRRIKLPVGSPSFDNSLVLAPLYVDYLRDSEDKFRVESSELKQRIGTASHVLLGFSAFLAVPYPAMDLNQPLQPAAMQKALTDVDTIVQRARANGLIAHISIISGFYHEWNDLRESAIRQDVRNAQWFSDGLIAPEGDLKDPNTVPHSVWITPTRYALPLRSRVEEGARIVGARIAHNMAQFPATLTTVGGDGEVELTYERNFLGAGERLSNSKEVIYTDYSPFMVAEFRDSLRKSYEGDQTPATDDDHDGRTFNADFGQNFTTWKLRYYENSGPIAFSDYVKLESKLPTSGRFFIDGGFDAPRKLQPNDRFWKAWLQFRKHAVANWVRDFADWITHSPDPDTGFTIPPSRYYAYQIPADFIFGESDNLRLRTSASYVETALIEPIGSPGVTAFNGYNGKRHLKTATPKLYSALYLAGTNWGILEYNPSIPYDNAIPPSGDESYYLSELHQLYAFRPHLIVPFAWSDIPIHKRYSIKGSAFERGLRRFVQEAGNTPWFSWKTMVKPEEQASREPRDPDPRGQRAP